MQYANTSYFYPRSPRGERLINNKTATLELSISIHAPREGSDVLKILLPIADASFLSTLPARGATRAGQSLGASFGLFLSTLPARGATARKDSKMLCISISIHAPREGSDDHLPQDVAGAHADFYPRSPRGERPRQAGLTAWAKRFLSTLPARGATRA